MTTFIIALVLVVLFVIGLISPHAAGKVQSKTDDEAHVLKRLSNWFWDPITWWSKKSIEFTRKAMNKSAKLGKKTHKKL